jgi:hypothetical protein
VDRFVVSEHADEVEFDKDFMGRSNEEFRCIHPEFPEK